MFSHILTDGLRSKGKKTMTTEYAWKHADAVEVITYLSKKECAILGGDVLNDNFSYTHDNWYYPENISFSLERNIRESAAKAIEYVDWHNKNFGDDFYYILVAIEKADYLLMICSPKTQNVDQTES